MTGRKNAARHVKGIVMPRRESKMSIDDSQYIKGIKETGFGLEYAVSKSLIQNGWTVINNKYYIDDVQGTAREKRGRCH